MSRKNHRSEKLLKLIPGLEVSKNNNMPPPSKNHKHDCYDNKRTLRPRYNPPSISIPNTSSDDSFMDTPGNEKNRDETYVPVTDDDTTDSLYLNDDLSASLNNMSNCTRDLTSGSISLELNTDEIHLIDQVTIDALNKLEQSQYHENVLVPTIESVDPYVSKNHTVTSQSSSPGQSSNPSIRDLVPTTSTYTADNDSPSSYDSHHSDYLEIDNSDQDETYHPASTPTYSDSSNDASFKEVAGDSLINTKGISPIRCLRGDKKIYVEPMSSADYTEVKSSNELGKKKKRTRTKDYCFYCETDVLNFARHIARNHTMECEVQKILSYPKKTETIYCRILLLNRRRPGELQRLLLSTYQECHNNSNAYEEFGRAISDAEKMLIKSFKRIVIRGKRGRGVPALLTDEVQADIDLLISIRQKYISNKNQFLFAKPGSENTLCGYKVLEKYANASGAKNPTAITTTKLRKHLATLTQMFNMKETDIEQLANFMGHTQAVHRQNYRLPDDVYQTAKLSKLLLLMESGDADYYKGKSLDDIDLDLEQDFLQDTHEDIDQNDEIMEYEAVMPTENLNEPIIDANVHDSTLKTPQLCEITNSTENKTKKKRNLVPWTAQQKNIVTKFFSKHIKSQVPPKRHECEELRDLYPDIMHNKDWLKTKVFVQNAYTKGKK
ncbi:unnamed protein product [Diatraea saccharalis]|uniref:Uncharacterized protein n=1 Tax=Diatraea saccharalis TaxID=40085 RepID=A0A9P1FAA6_9NEOP|nr:unnamed protein product [Diatraea saccharalis]